MPPGSVAFEELRHIGVDAGLDAFGCTGAEPFDEARAALEERKAAGLHGSMQFTYRNPSRATDPQQTLPGARTLLVGAASYHRGAPPRPVGKGPVARTARYVWADDQDRLLAALAAVADALRARGFRAVVVSDQNNLVDRAAAHRAGLGWFGKNANLLLPGHGSWFLLGAVITEAVVERTGAGAPVGGEAVSKSNAEAPAVEGCGTCTRCLDACPTGAIVAPGVVDARRCLAWSLQVTGPFPREHREAVGDRLYGCDECQEVCPPNRRERRRSQDEGGGHTVLDGDPERAWIPLLELLAASDQELLERHGRWYIPRREARYLRRNALVVLGNVGDGRDPDVRAALALALADADPMLRAHAVWSARRLGCDDLTTTLRADPDPEVQTELVAPHPTSRRRLTLVPGIGSAS